MAVACASLVLACKSRTNANLCTGIGAVPPARAAKPARAKMEPAPWLMGARRVAVVQSGTDVAIVAAGRRWVRSFGPTGTPRGEANGVGMAQALHVTDVDADGQKDVIVGRGRGRGVMSAPPSVAVYLGARFEQPPETIPLPRTSRAQVVGIASDPRRPGRLWIGSFESKYMVALVEATRDAPGRWTTRTLGTHRVMVSLVAADVERDGTTDVVAARPYGETKEQPGFAFVARTPPLTLPTVGGARAVAVTDGGAGIVVAEGWHFQYGHNAKALIVRYQKRACGWQREVLAHVAGRHGYDRLVVADVDGDRVPDVVAAGDGPGIYTHLHGRGGAYSFGREVAYDAAVADIDGDTRPEVILVGKQPGIWRVAPGS